MASAGNINAGGAVVTISGDASPLESILKKAAGKVQEFGLAIADIGAGLVGGAAVIGAAGASITAPFLYGLSVLEQWGDETQRIMRQTGLSFTDVDLLANGLRGNLLEPISGGQLVAGLAEMNKFLGGARSGAEGATRALAEMGLSAGQLQSMSDSDRLMAIADGLDSVTDSGRRSAIAMEIFGRRNASAMNLQGGSAGIRERDARVQELQGEALHGGASLEAANVVRLAWNEMKLATQGFWATLGVVAAPVMRDLYQATTNVIVKIRQWAEANKPLLSIIFRVGTIMVYAASAIGTLGGVLMTVGKTLAFMPMIWGMIAGVLWPVIAGFLVVGKSLLVIGAVALTAYIAIRAFGSTVAAVWGVIVDWVSSIIDAIDWIDVLTGVVIYVGSMLLISFSPAIIVIGLIAAQVYLLYQAFMYVFDLFVENWPLIQSFFSMIYERVSIIVATIRDAFRTVFMSLFGWLVDPFMAAFNWIASGFRALFGEFRSVVSGAVDTVFAVAGDISTAFGGIGNMISAGDWAGAFQIGMLAIQLIWERTKNFLLDTWYRVVFLFGTAWDAMTNGLSRPMRVMLEAIVTVFYAFLSGIERAINTMIVGLNAAIAELPANLRPAMLESIHITGGEGSAIQRIRNALGGEVVPREQQQADRERQNQLQAEQEALAERARFDAENQAIWDAMVVGGGPRRGGGGGLEFGAGVGSFSAAALGNVGSVNYAERTANAVEALVPGVRRVGDLLEGDDAGVVQ